MLKIVRKKCSIDRKTFNVYPIKNRNRFSHDGRSAPDKSLVFFNSQYTRIGFPYDFHLLRFKSSLPPLVYLPKTPEVCTLQSVILSFSVLLFEARLRHIKILNWSNFDTSLVIGHPVRFVRSGSRVLFRRSYKS